MRGTADRSYAASTTRVARLAALVALGPGQRLGLRQRLRPGELLRAQPAARDVVPIEKDAGPIVRKADLERPGFRDGFVFYDADATGGHGSHASIHQHGASLGRTVTHAIERLRG